MNIDAFVRTLASLAPTREQLGNRGLTPEEICMIQKTFIAQPRTANVIEWKATNELEKLITAYDCSTVEISSIRFLSHPLSLGADTQVASSELDPVVVRSDGSVTVMDHSALCPIIECSATSDGFLAGILDVAIIRSQKGRWTGRAAEAAARCAEKAGGCRYNLFFASLLGFLR